MDSFKLSKMKKLSLILWAFVTVSCTKTATLNQSTSVGNIVSTPSAPSTPVFPTLPAGYYVNKTSYQLKPALEFINVDSLRKVFGIQTKGIFNGTNNLGYVYVDMNNDGLEDIFYPYSSDGNYQIKPDVFINKGGNYILDNSMLPQEFTGTVLTRKTLVSDFNNDSLPDLFLINSGWDAAPFSGESCVLLLSDKLNKKYKLGDLTILPSAFWHGGASGDLNNDGNIDLIVLGGKPAKILYGNGKGEFSSVDWKYNAGQGYITSEIVDVDKDGQNDIILTGDEGRPAPALYSISTVFFNLKTDFSKQSIICPASTTGWGTVMDIICEDIDNDGIKEIILDRTGDISSIWYGGYNLNVYKSVDGFKTFNTIDLIKDNLVTTPVIGNWITKMILSKNKNNQLIIQCDVSGCYGYTDYRKNPFIKVWTQNASTKIFE